MKTRTLLLLSVACGLAVLLAGAGLLWKLASQPEPAPPHVVGEAVHIGDATVVVRDAQRTGQGALTTLNVRLTVSGVDDADGASDFRLLAVDRLVAPAEDSPCRAFTVGPTECELVFRPGVALPNPVGLAWRRAGDQLVWQLRYEG